jgi:hypothetical protein
MLFIVLQVLAILLTAVAMSPAVAHAFEFPGKMRLGRESYSAVQAIYYPGFTVLGMAEPAAILAVLLLLILSPRGTPAFALTLIALAALAGMQIMYWLLVYPTNSFWMRSPGGSVFAFRPAGRTVGVEPDWTRRRDRWEYSHIARAALAFIGFLALVMAALGAA